MKKAFSIILLSISLASYSQMDSLVIKSINIPKTYFAIYFADSIPKLINGNPYTGIDTSTFWYVDKKLLAIETFKDGFKTEVKTFYETGKPERYFQFKNGKREGISKGWYESGKEMFDDEMKEGKYVGTHISFNESGNPEYISDEKRDFYINFYANGKTKLYVKYINISSRCKNKKAFEQTEWYENGQLMRKGIMNCGKQLFQEFYNDTTIGIEGTLIDMDLFLVGKYTKYYKTGTIMLVGQYQDGNTQSEANIRTGVWKYYNEKGKLEKEEYYENNKLIKTKEYSKPKKIEENKK